MATSFRVCTCASGDEDSPRVLLVTGGRGALAEPVSAGLQLLTMATSVVWAARLLLQALPFSVLLVDGVDEARYREQNLQELLSGTECMAKVLMVRGNAVSPPSGLPADVVVLPQGRAATLRNILPHLLNEPVAARAEQGPGDEAKVLVDAASRTWGLSPQESVVAHLLLTGLANKQMAGELRCSERRIESLIESIGRKARSDPARNRRVQLVSGMFREAARRGTFGHAANALRDRL